MTRHWHWLEKIQVELAAAAAMAVTYFAVWPLVRPWDSMGPACFAPYGEYGDLGVLACAMIALGAAVGLVTTTARPEGAMLAVVVGAGGIAIHSPQMRYLLMISDGAIGTVYRSLIAEVLLLAAAVLAASLALSVVRAIVSRAAPRLVWRDPLESPGQAAGGLLSSVLRLATFWRARSGAGGGDQTGRCVAFAVSAMAISTALLMVLLQSSDRGQVLFALFAAFFVGVLVAHQVFMAPCGLVAWALPVVLAVALYALAGRIDVGAEPQGWMRVPLYGCILPIDWVTAGIGGAVFGFWLSSRIHEVRLLEKLKSTGETNVQG